MHIFRDISKCPLAPLFKPTVPYKDKVDNTKCLFTIPRGWIRSGHIRTRMTQTCLAHCTAVTQPVLPERSNQNGVSRPYVTVVSY